MVRLVCRTLDETLPIDILATHYPDARGQIMLNVALTLPYGLRTPRAVQAAARARSRVRSGPLLLRARPRG
ncbi:hypothetical protein [Streptomyces sp. NPDC002133]|uniref:hypothetical protein n=1 Tax=Streptomyces sp. NPDC002133 TaxID=3154409 RepID=UPI0033298327